MNAALRHKTKLLYPKYGRRYGRTSGGQKAYDVVEACILFLKRGNRLCDHCKAMILEILTNLAPALRRNAKLVTSFDEAFTFQAIDLVNTMLHPNTEGHSQ
jgi:hypothetical protein